MAGTLLPPSWTPIGSLYATVGTPFTQTFTYARSDIDGNPLEVDIGFVTTSGGSTYLSNGSTVFPGVVTQSNSPDNSCSITISGTPTLVGTYTIYAKGNFGTGYTPKTYTVSVTGGSALTTLPLSGTVSPSAQQGGEYVSSAFVILNGSSNYILTLTGAPASIGLSSNPTPGSGVTSLITTSNTFYLVNKSSMVPTSGEVGSSTITINVHDNILDQLLNSFDIEACPVENLNIIANILGFPINKDDDPDFMRRSLRNAIALYKAKGTADSVKVLFYNLGFYVDVVPLWTPDFTESVQIFPPYVKATISKITSGNPYKPGYYDITIINPDNQSDTSVGAFQYLNLI